MYIYMHIYINIYMHAYRVVPGSRNWQVETADWNLAGFLHYFQKPAGRHLGQFLKIYNNWV